MSGKTKVSMTDLRDAHEWLCAAEHGSGDAAAYVSRATGKVLHSSDENLSGVEDEPLPDDVADIAKFAVVPGRHDLDLGSHVAFDFARDHMPADVDAIRDLFRGRGAYGRFKSFLARRGMLDAWHAYEDAVIDNALRRWCADEGFVPA